MKYRDLVLAAGLVFFVFSVNGCVVRTYTVKKDRVDQELSGNGGYLNANKPMSERKERRTQRQYYVAEVELGKTASTERKVSAAQVEDKEALGNRGYMGESSAQQEVSVAQEEKAAKMETYTVQKGDTLQKISQKLYGTTKNWYNIYKANKDTLKGPDKVYPGQVINVPVLEKVSAAQLELKEPKENLK